MRCWPRCCRSAPRNEDQDQPLANDPAVLVPAEAANPSLDVQEEAALDWQTGGKYKVLQPTTLWTLPRARSEKICDLFPQDLVSVIQVETVGGGPRGALRWALVVPPQRELGAGWLLLDDASGNDPLDKRRSAGSWDVPGRYYARHSAVLRTSPSLISKEISEVKPGDEVLVVKLGLNPKEESDPVRLRAQVKTHRGEVGWLSLENSSGTALLDTTNLLSRDVVDVHKRSLHAEMTGTWTPNTPTIGRSLMNGTGNIPWHVGGVYRTLEDLPLLERPEAAGRDKQVLSGGTLVGVQEVADRSCDDLGHCPFVRVTVQDGPQEGKKGWLRCAAKDGHDLVDTRDQHEHHQVLDEIAAVSGPSPSYNSVPASPNNLANSLYLTTICQAVPQAHEQQGPATNDVGLPLATHEICAEDRPMALDPGEQIDDAMACGHCSCRILPADKSHPTIWTTDHDSMHPLPVAPLSLQVQPLSSADFEAWVNGVYASSDRTEAVQVPDLLAKYRGKEPELVRSLCRRYQVGTPKSWYRVASESRKL
eukprot:TRINITY_DN27721_c0_g2_i1.p1 TRINITY_DN27721_c0_g2~~TRINITY_DN27721_c0_g2_i1.p1  ORF type:complete len:535 (-),score=76.68 TRINITY_DN27721_c0_g2_i1:47-1651(-)